MLLSRLPHQPIVLGSLAVLGANLLLTVAYLWSRGGQSNHLRMEALGDQFTVYVDGRLQTQATFPAAPKAGSLILDLEDTSTFPSLPLPRGIDSVRVTDLPSGDVLFMDDFSARLSDGWTQSGNFRAEAGVLSVMGPGSLFLKDRKWEDYAIDVWYKNLTGGSLIIRGEAPRSGVAYIFRPFRHLDNFLVLMEDGKTVASAPGAPIRTSESELIRSMTAMALAPYPFGLALLLVGSIIAGALQFLPRPQIPHRLSGAWTALPTITAVAAAATALGITASLTYTLVALVPHVPDEVSYIFQANLLASGRLAAPLPPVQDAFEFFYPALIAASGDRWASVYPFGHPLVLAIGAKLGAMWLIPPLIGAGCVALIFAVGRRIYGPSVGVLAALLLALSPFFLMTASNLMSHNTAAFYILGALLCLAFIDRRPALCGVLAGVFSGLLLNTRPLTAAALAIPFAVFFLTLPLRCNERRLWLRAVAGAFAGGLAMLGAYFLYNYGTTGLAMTSGYQTGGDLSQVVGFGGRHTLSAGLANEQTQMAALLLVLNGWHSHLGLFLVLAPFVLATRRFWDWFLMACAAFTMGAWTLYEGSGLMHGPRYWYEAVPFLMLLSASGAAHAARALNDAAAWLRRKVAGTATGPLWAGSVLVYGLVGIVAAGASYGWLTGERDTWGIDMVPGVASRLRGFNGVDDHLTKLVDAASLSHALVLVENCTHWQCYGNVFWLNAPTLDGNIVFARYIDARLREVLAKFPDRPVYVARYSGNGSLAPFAPPADDGTTPSAGVALLARDVRLPTPTPTPIPPPTPTPDPDAARKRDDARRRDLASIAEALQRYHQVRGGYPAAGVQSFCAYPSDAGCQVAEILSPLPRDPSPGATYWYSSDTRVFTVFASLESPAGASNCPSPTPDHLRSVPNLYCAQGRPGPPP